MEENNIKKIFLRVVVWLVLTILFVISVGGMNVLYFGNQTNKFLYGMAAAGRGELSVDWLANTKDPLPIFSFLVQMTEQYLNESFFYVYQVLLNGVFLFSIVGIVDHFYNIKRNWKIFLVFISLFFLSISTFWPSDSPYVLYDGVASQDIDFNTFLPNSFGVFLFLSLYLFLKKKRVAALFVMAIAYYFHPAYLISGAALVAIFMLLDYLENKNIKQVLMIAGIALAIVSPVLIWNFTANADATVEQIQQATHIIVNERIPHHTIVSRWWGINDFIKVVILLAALMVTHRTKLFPILAVGFVFFAVPTLAMAIRPSNQINILQLWRVSVLFVPLSTTVLLAWGVSKMVSAENSNLSIWQTGFFIFLVGIAVYVGVQDQQSKITEYQNRLALPMMEFITSNHQSGDQYLVPIKDLNFQDFKLQTGVPLMVNWKSNPWNALDTLEWYERVEQGMRFYTLPQEKACDKLSQLQEWYGITHVVLPSGKVFYCEGDEIYKDTFYKVYQLEP